MKKLFPGYFRENTTNINSIWETSLFVFDANILLNIYRYSDITRTEFLKILEKIKDRIWLPHRAAEEYFNNRLSVIGEQEKAYDETIKSIESLKSKLNSSRQHPFVSQDIMNDVDKVFDSLSNELDKNKAVHTTRISNDEIKESIATIFEDKVGNPYDDKKIKEIISEGKERYEQNVPPGYRDGKKFKDSEIFVEQCRKFGDLIIWNQIIDKSKESKLGIIFITDDRKDDWWEIFNGKTVGSRPELVKEFQDKANHSFYMYKADRFLELVKKNLNEEVSDEIVEEIREVDKREKLTIFETSKVSSDLYSELDNKIVLENDINLASLLHKKVEINNKTTNLMRIMNHLEDKIFQLQKEKIKSKEVESRRRSDVVSEEEIVKQDLAEIRLQYRNALNDIDAINYKISKLQENFRK